MDIILKKVVELQFLKSNIDKNIDFYLNEEKNELLLDGKFVTIDEICEPIMENAKISLSEDEFIQYLSREKWKQNYDIGRLLYKKLVKFNDISGDILDESFWVYITHIPYVKKYIIKRYFNTINDDEDQNLKLIDTIFCGDMI